MKRNTMHRLFDNMDTIPESLESIDENTVYAETGIQYENIENAVKAELGLKKSKKHRVKKIVLTLIAATLTIGILSTSAIAAMGGLKSAFGDIFSGDLNASHLYSGGNVQISTNDENLNVELLGVSGDDITAYAAIELTKKDGTSFTHHKLSTVTIPMTTSFDENLFNLEDYDYSAAYDHDPEKFKVDIETTLWEKMRYRQSYNGSVGRITYNNGWKQIWDTDSFDGDVEAKVLVSDNGSKLKMYVKIISPDVSPKGRTIHISSQELSEYIPEKILKTFSQADEEAYQYIQEHFAKNKIDGRLIDNGQDCDYWQIRNERIPVQFDISFTMNYKSDVKQFKVDEQNAKTLFALKDNDNAEIIVSPFGINILSENAEDSAIPIFNSQNTKVIMQDGTVYRTLISREYHYADVDSVSLEYRKDNSTFDFDSINHLDYSNFASQAFLNSELDMIDIEKIDTIQMNDCIIKVNS